MEKIKVWMQADELTYEKLATRIGWSRQNLWLKMNKSVCPNFDTVRKIVEAMGRDIQITPRDDFTGIVDLNKLYETAEEQQVSFEMVEELFNAIGYEFRIEKTQ